MFLVSILAITLAQTAGDFNVMEWARGVGFPAAVAFYVLTRMEKAVNGMAKKLDRLIIKLGGDPDTDRNIHPDFPGKK